MQRVTYVSAYGESIVFGAEGPVLLRSVSGFGKPDSEAIRTQGAYQSGEMFSHIRLPGRSVLVQFDVLPQESRKAMYEQRMDMERVLSASRSMRGAQIGMLIYENDAGAWVTRAVPDGQIAYGRRFQNAMAGGSLRFFCPDAYLRARDAQQAQMRMGQSGMTLPATLPARLGSRKFRTSLVNSGTADAPMTMTIYGTGEMPTVVNHTTGAKIVVSRVIANGERLVISTDPQNLVCELHSADGKIKDAFGYLDPSIAVSGFLLIPGSNDVEYMPSVVSTDSRVEITWHSYFEGV